MLVASKLNLIVPGRRRETMLQDMEMEATIVFWGYLRIMENNREDTNYSILAILGLYRFFYSRA